MAERRGIKRAHESPQKNNSPFQHETDEYSGCTGDDEDYENYWNRRQAESDQEAETQLEKEEDEHHLEKVADFGTIDKYVAAVKRGGVAIQMKPVYNLDQFIEQVVYDFKEYAHIDLTEEQKKPWCLCFLV